MSEKHRIGLKYCGGCNPRHDRVQTAAQIRERLKDKVDFVSHEDEAIEGVLIVTGCSTACVDQAPFARRPVWTVAGPEDVEGFIDEMDKRFQ